MPTPTTANKPTEVVFRFYDLSLAREIYKSLAKVPSTSARSSDRLEFVFGSAPCEADTAPSPSPSPEPDSVQPSVKDLAKNWLLQATQAERDMPRGDQLQALIEFAGHEGCFLDDECPTCRRIKGTGVRCLQQWQNTHQFCPVSNEVREERGQHEETWREAISNDEDPTGAVSIQ